MRALVTYSTTPAGPGWRPPAPPARWPTGQAQALGQAPAWCANPVSQLLIGAPGRINVMLYAWAEGSAIVHPYDRGVQVAALFDGDSPGVVTLVDGITQARSVDLSPSLARGLGDGRGFIWTLLPDADGRLRTRDVVVADANPTTGGSETQIADAFRRSRAGLPAHTPVILLGVSSTSTTTRLVQTLVAQGNPFVFIVGRNETRTIAGRPGRPCRPGEAGSSTPPPAPPPGVERLSAPSKFPWKPVLIGVGVITAAVGAAYGLSYVFKRGRR